MLLIVELFNINIYEHDNHEEEEHSKHDMASNRMMRSNWNVNIEFAGEYDSFEIREEIREVGVVRRQYRVPLRTRAFDSISFPICARSLHEIQQL